MKMRLETPIIFVDNENPDGVHESWYHIQYQSAEGTKLWVPMNNKSFDNLKDAMQAIEKYRTQTGGKFIYRVLHIDQQVAVHVVAGQGSIRATTPVAADTTPAAGGSVAAIPAPPTPAQRPYAVAYDEDGKQIYPPLDR